MGGQLGGKIAIGAVVGVVVGVVAAIGEEAIKEEEEEIWDKEALDALFNEIV